MVEAKKEGLSADHREENRGEEGGGVTYTSTLHLRGVRLENAYLEKEGMKD